MRAAQAPQQLRVGRSRTKLSLTGRALGGPIPSIRNLGGSGMPRFMTSAVYGSAALAFATLVGWSSAAQSQTTTLTMSSWVPPSHLITKDVLVVWAQNVEKAKECLTQC